MRGCPLASYRSARGLNPFQIKAAEAGFCCPDSENPSWASGGEGAGPGSKQGSGSTWSPGEVFLGEKEAKKEEGEPGNPDKFRGRQERGLGDARLHSGTPAPGLARG